MWYRGVVRYQGVYGEVINTNTLRTLQVSRFTFSKVQYYFHMFIPIPSCFEYTLRSSLSHSSLSLPSIRSLRFVSLFILLSTMVAQHGLLLPLENTLP